MIQSEKDYAVPLLFNFLYFIYNFKIVIKSNKRLSTIYWDEIISIIHFIHFIWTSDSVTLLFNSFLDMFKLAF